MMARTSIRPARTGLATLLLLLPFASCVTPTSDGGGEPVPASFQLLSERQPADVAVAPLFDKTGRRDAPLDALRGELAATLVERLYSPLSVAYVDANWVDSSFRGTPPPDALLSVTLTRWDPSRLYSTGFVRVGADLVLFEGADSTGRVLWRESLSRDVDLRSGNGRPPGPDAGHLDRAIELFAREALAGLPERDPVAAHPVP